MISSRRTAPSCTVVARSVASLWSKRNVRVFFLARPLDRHAQARSTHRRRRGRHRPGATQAANMMAAQSDQWPRIDDRTTAESKAYWARYRVKKENALRLGRNLPKRKAKKEESSFRAASPSGRELHQRRNADYIHSGRRDRARGSRVD